MSRCADELRGEREVVWCACACCVQKITIYGRFTHYSLWKVDVESHHILLLV